jgi:diaminopimelate decarboxylase
MRSILPPKIHPFVRKVICRTEDLFALMRLHNGPVHIIFPEIFSENALKFKECFLLLGIEGCVHFAHKPNKSKVFVRTASACGINIDVSSYRELVSALANGFVGERICCTGPKNTEFLIYSMIHGCLISIDSVHELLMIQKLKKVSNCREVRILIRISDPNVYDRNFHLKPSRFGVHSSELQKLLDILNHDKNVVLEGIHFHNYESSEIKAKFVESILEIFDICRNKGLFPGAINIGGGFRNIVLEEYNYWSDYIDTLSGALKENRNLDTWRNYTYGLALHEDGVVVGREKLMGEFSNKNAYTILSEIFSEEDNLGRSLAKTIRENLIKVMIEPGSSIFDQCGVTLTRIVSTKVASDGNVIVVIDANTYNFSTNMQEQLMDPILIVREDRIGSCIGECKVYIVGNLCKEGDFIMKRIVYLQSIPESGDILCFINTAAYVSDFEDSSPLQQSQGKKFVAQTAGEKITFSSEDLFLPFIDA